MFSLDIIITFIPIIFGLGLGIVVYFGKKDLSNKVFGFLCFSIVLWTIANYLSLHPVSFTTLFWIRLVMFFAVFLQFMFFLFVHLFPQNKIIMQKTKFTALAVLAFLAMASTLSNLVYSGLEGRGEILPVPGPLMPIFVLAIFLFLGLAAFYALKKYYLSKGGERDQWRGILLMFFLLIMSQFIAVIVFKNSDFIKFGPLFTLPFIVFSAYAIIKHHLLNIRVIAAELLTIFILLVLLIKVFLSRGIDEFLLNLIILSAAGVFGILLIKAVLKEVKSREQLEALSRTKSEFLSIASHQLRTPLAAIKGYISMIIEGTYGAVSEKMAAPLRNIRASNERLIRLINTLLNISRIESGRTELALEKTSLEEIISSVIDELKLAVQEKNLYINWQKPDSPAPLISLDKEKIRQVIMNVIDNAIKYTNRGGIAVKLEIENWKSKIIVSDTGEGMDDKEIASIFNSFSRGQAGYKFWTEGTGLGLYVAKKFVDMHHGRIWAESAGRGQGSIFYIELPM